MSLEHPAVEFVNRLKNGDTDAAIGMAGQLTRGGLKYALYELAEGELDWDEESVIEGVYADGSASVTKTELLELVRYVSELQEGGE